MQQQTAKFMEFLSSNDKLRMNELKQIEQEQYYISQLKEQRERMEVLKVEFLKKDQVIAQLQMDNQSLVEEFDSMRSAIQKLKKQTIERDELARDVQELRELVRHLREENENLNSLHSQSLDKIRENDERWMLENEQLKTEIAKLDQILFATEPLKEENYKLKEELKAFKSEKKKIHNEMRQSRIEIGKQLDEFKQVIQDQQNEIYKLQQYKENSQQFKMKYQEIIQQLEELKQENMEMKLELKRFYEKEESEIKMKSEIDRVRQDLISVRNQEVEKLNELFQGIFKNGSLDHSRERFI